MILVYGKIRSEKSMVIKNNSSVVEKYRKQLIAAKKKLGGHKITFAKKTDLTAKKQADRLTTMERAITKDFKKQLSVDIKNLKGLSDALKNTDEAFK